MTRHKNRLNDRLVLPKIDYKEENVFRPDTKRTTQKYDTMTRQKKDQTREFCFRGSLHF